MNSPSSIQSAELAKQQRVRHGFFGREGGVSSGIFTSLNCGLASGDVLADVKANRGRVRDALGMDALFTLKQIHSNRVVVVDESTDLDGVVEADGLVTRLQGIGIGALGADCAPVLFCDPEAGLIGAAHAGWQGALNGVTDEVITQMCSLGAEKNRITCAVGPAIGWDSYEVGEEFRDRFVSQSPIDGLPFFRIGKSGSVYFNLPGYIHERLRSSGVKAVDVIGADTYANEAQYFSYRRSCHRNEEGYGRQVGVIGLAAD